METIKRTLNESVAARWGVLVLVGFVLSVNYYFYDAFSTLKGDLTSQLKFTGTHYGLFASAYSFPNTFLLMAVIGGIILDKLGIRRTGFMFVGFMTLGAVLTAYGASDFYRSGGFMYPTFSSFLSEYSPEFKMMFVGRIFFGLGAETCIVVVSKILVKWFKGKDLALAFGLKIGFARIGTFAALQISPRISQSGLHLSSAIWFAAILVTIGLLAFMVYMLLDFKYDKNLTQANRDAAKNDFSMADFVKILTNRTFLFIAALCVTFYSAVFPFLQFAPDLFSNKYGYTAVESGAITSLLPVGTIFFTPFFGFLIDRYGKSATAMILGALVLFFVHLLFTFTTIPPHIPVLFLGIAFSLIPASMWPSMVKLVEEKQIGTAYGLMYSIQNLGLWITPLITGYVLDITNAQNAVKLDYTKTMLIYIVLSLVAVVAAVILKFENSKRNLGMELPLNKKKEEK